MDTPQARRALADWLGLRTSPDLRMRKAGRQNIPYARIEDGAYPPGSQMPTRRELREEFSASDTAIDKAMMILRTAGLTETLPGVGVYVASHLSSRCAAHPHSNHQRRAAPTTRNQWPARAHDTSPTYGAFVRLTTYTPLTLTAMAPWQSANPNQSPPAGPSSRASALVRVGRSEHRAPRPVRQTHDSLTSMAG